MLLSRCDFPELMGRIEELIDDYLTGAKVSEGDRMSYGQQFYEMYTQVVSNGRKGFEEKLAKDITDLPSELWTKYDIPDDKRKDIVLLVYDEWKIEQLIPRYIVKMLQASDRERAFDYAMQPVEELIEAISIDRISGHAVNVTKHLFYERIQQHMSRIENKDVEKQG